MDQETYERIIEIIDEIKTDERPRDSDEYAAMIYDALGVS